MNEPIKVITKGNKELRIYQDELSDSPREWDNLGKMYCTHRRYILGDTVNTRVGIVYKNWDEVEKYLIKEHKAKVILPLYLYDHSGLRMKVGSFQGLLPQGHAEFDSGQVGFIFATDEDIKKEFSVKKISKKLLQKVETILNNEVKVYDQFLSGDVYCFQVVEKSTCDKCKRDHEDIIDSCHGFYGTGFKENGLFESARWE